MKSSPLYVCACFVLSLVLAGCINGQDGAATARRPEAPNATPEFGADTGAIIGEVLDDEALPIVDAAVGIPKLDKNARTDDAGRFALNHVPPGTYDVFATAVGFEGASRRVTVEAGSTTPLVSFTLAPLPSDDPYRRTHQFRAQLSGVMWKLTPQCIYTDVNPLVKTCGGVRFNQIQNPLGGNVTAGCAACETHTNKFKDFTPEWQSLIVELKWQPQSGATGKGFLLDVNAPNITRGQGGSINQADKYTRYKASNRSPIQIRVDKDQLEARGIKAEDWNNPPGANCGTGENCDWFFRVFPAAYDLGIGEEGFGPDYGIMYENVADIYLSYWVREKAPEGWTALPE